jgi:DNA polymerase I-like protein with 3'-5' exonuclease and polymerase domains
VGSELCIRHRAVSLDVPIKADVGAGRNWFEAH